MTPSRDLSLDAYRAEVARRVNLKLAADYKGHGIPEVFSAARIGRVLAGGTGYCGSRHADLIREIAAEVAAEMGATTS